MKRIGMLTFHQCHNYGAMLCAFALQQSVTSLGYLSEYIDLENDIFDEHGKKAGHQLYRKNDIAAQKYRIRYQNDLKERWMLFENFKKMFLKLSIEVKNAEEMEVLMENYDLILVGGDQLWNEKLPVSLDVFAVPFRTNLKRVSFGTSMGDAREMSLRRRMFLRKFSSIGVREMHAARYIKKYTQISPVVTVDPVFLLEKEEWYRLSISPKEDKYIFAYIFNKNDVTFLRWIEQLHAIADKYQKKVIVCASDGFEESKFLRAKVAVGPREWLGYISNAEFVITNSFHGVAFSLLFERNFLCLDIDCRKKELLSFCDLMGRAELDLSEYELLKDEKIDYRKVKHVLQERIEQSCRFLEQELR